jgi:hypothetical protein
MERFPAYLYMKIRERITMAISQLIMNNRTRVDSLSLLEQKKKKKKKLALRTVV